MKFAQDLYGIDAKVVGRLSANGIDVKSRLPPVGESILSQDGVRARDTSGPVCRVEPPANSTMNLSAICVFGAVDISEGSSSYRASGDDPSRERVWSR